MNKRCPLLIASCLLITLGLLFSAARASTEGNCAPQGTNAGETVQGCPNLIKTAIWDIVWPDGYSDQVTLFGSGQCGLGTVCCDATLRSTECWPLFDPPVESSSGKWSVRVTNRKASSTVTSCPGGCGAATIISCQTTGSTTFSAEHPCPSAGGSCYNGQDMPFCQSPEHADLEQCCCATSGGECNSPILIDVAGDGFRLTGPQDGVSFDIDSNGAKEHLSWTTVKSDDAWLILDRNHNGTVDSGQELFGNYTPQPLAAIGKNGFLALAVFDTFANGGNGDRVIDQQDAVFSSLRLWADTNHNGVSEPSEMSTLDQAGVAGLEVDYKSSRRTDDFGNSFRYRAKVRDVQRAQIGRWAWDVFLRTSL
jgi:hypothetical protein